MEGHKEYHCRLCGTSLGFLSNKEHLMIDVDKGLIECEKCFSEKLAELDLWVVGLGHKNNIAVV